MIIAIDGPAGAGKSTTARAVAARFGFAYIDTGAMYRAVALAVSEAQLAPGSDDEAIVCLARELPLHIAGNGESISIGDRDVSEEIRAPQVGQFASVISSLAPVREVIVAQQRRLAREGESDCGGAVLEGRDIQTVVFPDAEVKIFLTADVATRAERRLDQWIEVGHGATVEEAAGDISQRDQRDSLRTASPLCAAADAEHISTDHLSTVEVVARIAQLVDRKRGVAHV